MFLLLMKMVLLMMIFAAVIDGVKNQPKTSDHHLVHDDGDTDSDDVDVDVGGSITSPHPTPPPL